MNEKNYNRLRVLEKTEELVETKATPAISRQINPMYRSVLKFHHEQIAKFSVKDLW